MATERPSPSRTCLSSPALIFCLLGWLGGIGGSPAVRADEAVWEGGIVALGHTLRQLETTARVLHIGAHPDDEDSALLAYLARSRGVRTAYLSLTRGEGGQNSLGPELYEALGVLRTSELLAARRWDGAEQYFARAFDFGFSKTAAETSEKWGREAILEDIVRCIRQFRPHVIVSRFRGDPSDGHGHHQAAGQLTREAFTAAADPACFPHQLTQEGLSPWQAFKLYTRTAWDSFEATLRINTGEYDPLYGRSCYEIAMASRSQHRCQNMGRIEARGAQFSAFKLLQRADGGPRLTREEDLLAGLDLSLSTLGLGQEPPLAPWPESLRQRLVRVERRVAYLQRALHPTHLQPVREGLEACLHDLRMALAELDKVPALHLQGKGGRPRRLQERWGAPDPGGKWAAARAALEQKEAEASRALALAAGLQCDAVADDGWIAPGQTVTVTQQLFAPKEVSIRDAVFSLKVPPGWTAVRAEPAVLPDGPARARTGWSVRVSDAAEPSVPYWFLMPRQGDRFDWPPADHRGHPFSPPPLRGVLEVMVGRTRLHLEQPVQYRYAQPDRGEVRQEVYVVPTLEVKIEPPLRIMPLDEETTGERQEEAGSQEAKALALSSSLEFTLRVRNFSRTAQHGELTLEVEGERGSCPVVSPRTVPFDLNGEDSETTANFTVAFPPSKKPADFLLQARAHTAVGDFARSVQIIHYPHVPFQILWWPAVSRVRAFHVRRLPHLRVGYIMGTGDEVPAALAQLGVQVTLLDDAALQKGDLSAWDTLLIGIRAYEVRPALRASNERLLEWVRNGGTLIVQYNQETFGGGAFAPYPLAIRRPHDRVTVEEAPVTVLQPQHPLFHVPNEIGPADFEGWVQERGLYFLHTWDDRYTPLLECHDPGEPPQRGGLVVADVGRGKYVYTGFAWFRQLPAGVPGAYRFLANLISLGHTRAAEG